MAVHLENARLPVSMSIPRFPTSYTSPFIRTDSARAGLSTQRRLFGRSPPNRPDGGLEHMHSQLPEISPTSVPSPGGYTRSGGSASTSPGSGPSPSYDTMAFASSAFETSQASRRRMSVARVHAQRRAYRQRRKDPSCDACRERKVKCDATDMTSCSECSGRRVKCQFTKETNKRMSSIKQIQDLETQLAQATQQLDQFRSTLGHHKGVELDRGLRYEHTVSRFDLQSRGPNRQARAKVFKHSRGIFKPSQPTEQIIPPLHSTFHLPQPPPKQTADHLLGVYNSTVHFCTPILHWSTFIKTYEKVYERGTRGTFVGIAPSWVSLFFSVLACGALRSVDHVQTRVGEGKSYIQQALSLMDVWNDDFTIDHAQASLLNSMAYMELNLKSASWIWLGSSARIAQDIGLHLEPSQYWSTVERETRKRVWWAIYTWERLLALDLGKPLQIDEEDCDVGLPLSFGNHSQFDNDIMGPCDSTTARHLFPATIQIARFVGSFKKALRLPSLDMASLRTFDSQYASCMAVFPAHCQVNSMQYLDPHALGPIISLQNARLILHRHNILALTAGDVRSVAIDRCVAAATDTANLLTRTMQAVPLSQSEGRMSMNWEVKLVAAASSLMCLHIWRCALLLCFRANYADAMICVKAAGVIGDSRSINVACGQYLEFFVQELIKTRARRGRDDPEQDEELLAYASGDLQGGFDASSTWRSFDMGTPTTISGSDSLPLTVGDRMDARADVKFPMSAPTTRGASEWSGWDQLCGRLQELLEEQRSTQYQSQTSASPGPQSQSPQPPTSSRGRISIASII